MKTPAQIRALINSNSAVSIAVIGDSTTTGFCCNSYPNVWTNGYPYGCVNLPDFGPNLVSSSPYFLNLNTYPSQAQQDNVLIPSAVRLFRTFIESKNPSSKVYNFGIPGAEASTHVAVSTVALVAGTVPKPDVVFLNLGINSAKQGIDQSADLQILINQVVAYDMLPVLVISNNVGVADNPYGVWVLESTPDRWVPMAYWQNTRAGVRTLATVNGLEYVDNGSDSGALDITKLYDAFHPNNLGHQDIANQYVLWTISAPVHPVNPTGKATGTSSIRVNGFPSRNTNGDSGALRIMNPDLFSILPSSSLTLKRDFSVRFNTSLGVASSSPI